MHQREEVRLASFGSQMNVVVVGAAGGISAALTELLSAQQDVATITA
ncbi:MAG: hypothetical protein AAFO01_10735 [Pseudomonadota bacterium]